MFEKNQETKCPICNSVITEDGFAVSCAGECDNPPLEADDYLPLNFNDDEVLRDLPDFVPNGIAFEQEYDADDEELYDEEEFFTDDDLVDYE